MSLRRIIYGYEIVNGKTTVLEEEAGVVRDIYADYLGGKSLKGIAAKLTEKGITYYLDKKVWTKNLIARIIANPSYAGADGYPAIVSQADFDLANKRKSEMGGTQAEIPEITALIKAKMVCARCGRNMGRQNKWGSREKWLCPSGCKVDLYLGDREIFSALLLIFNRVRITPELLRGVTAPVAYIPSIEVVRQSREIERVKEQAGTAFGIVAQMVLKCTACKYECCPLDRSQAMTDALVDRYRALPSVHELDMPLMPLIRETVQRISVNSNGTLTVLFVNRVEVTNGMEGGSRYE